MGIECGVVGQVDMHGVEHYFGDVLIKHLWSTSGSPLDVIPDINGHKLLRWNPWYVSVIPRRNRLGSGWVGLEEVECMGIRNVCSEAHPWAITETIWELRASDNDILGEKSIPSFWEALVAILVQKQKWFLCYQHLDCIEVKDAWQRLCLIFCSGHDVDIVPGFNRWLVGLVIREKGMQIKVSMSRPNTELRWAEVRSVGDLFRCDLCNYFGRFHGNSISMWWRM